MWSPYCLSVSPACAGSVGVSSWLLWQDGVDVCEFFFFFFPQGFVSVFLSASFFNFIFSSLTPPLVSLNIISVILQQWSVIVCQDDSHCTGHWKMVLCQTCARACCYNRLSSGPCTGLAVRSIWPLWYLSQDQPGVPSGLFGTHRMTSRVFHLPLWYSSQDQQGVPSGLFGTHRRTSRVFHLASLVLIA